MGDARDACAAVRTGLNFNTQGNISVRLPEHDAIVITPSDVRYDAMAPEDMWQSPRGDSR